MTLCQGFSLAILLFSFREGNVTLINIGEMDFISTRMAQKPVIYGCFRKWWYPQNTPKWSFLVGKPMEIVGETHHFRKHPYGAIGYRAIGPLASWPQIKAQTQELAGLTDSSLKCVFFWDKKRRGRVACQGCSAFKVSKNWPIVMG